MVDQMQPGDVLLYRGGDDLFSWWIRTKTWSEAAHVESYIGTGRVVGARVENGCQIYPVNPTPLAVLRPMLPFSLTKAMLYFGTVRGQPYDWVGLLSFYAARLQGIQNKRLFCSEFTTRWYRAGGIDPFHGYAADGIAPGEFLKSTVFDHIYLAKPIIEEATQKMNTIPGG